VVHADICRCRLAVQWCPNDLWSMLIVVGVDLTKKTISVSKIIHGIKYISFACTNISSSDNRILLYVDQMKYQLLSVNFFQSKTYLFTGWLVEHHTFASSTFYSFCDNILNGNFHLHNIYITVTQYSTLKNQYNLCNIILNICSTFCTYCNYQQHVRSEIKYCENTIYNVEAD
jgi:hypothetical protein